MRGPAQRSPPTVVVGADQRRSAPVLTRGVSQTVPPLVEGWLLAVSPAVEWEGGWTMAVQGGVASPHAPGTGSTRTD